MKVVFAGPSLHRDLPFLRRQQDGIFWHGPARCGDVTRAVDRGATAIGLIDGLFDQTAAPWHKEILYALSRRVAVAGGASMGALRAAECRAFGMVGIGAVFQDYASGVRRDDADVAQLHAPAELNYLPLTEPLVNVEPSLQQLVERGGVASQVGAALLATARGLHYTERTYAEIVRRCTGLAPARAAGIDAWLTANAVDRKRSDALAVLEWLRLQPAAQPPCAPVWRFEATTHWLHLRHALADGN